MVSRVETCWATVESRTFLQLGRYSFSVFSSRSVTVSRDWAAHWTPSLDSVAATEAIFSGEDSPEPMMFEGIALMTEPSDWVMPMSAASWKMLQKSSFVDMLTKAWLTESPVARRTVIGPSLPARSSTG